jgi:hypothetical protein
LNECKDYLKLKFGAKKDIIDIKTGEVHTQDKSIAGYSKSEMSEFIDACVQFLTHDLGLIVPEPI